MNATPIGLINDQLVIGNDPSKVFQPFIYPNQYTIRTQFQIGIVYIINRIQILLHVRAHGLNHHPFRTNATHLNGLYQTERLANQTINEFGVVFIGVRGIQNHLTNIADLNHCLSLGAKD